MPSIIYDDNAPKSQGGFVNYYNINANKGFLTHTYNILTLQWIRDHSENMIERQQCDKEIIIAQRKIDYHQKHPNFIPEAIAKELSEMKHAFTQPPSDNSPR